MLTKERIRYLILLIVGLAVLGGLFAWAPEAMRILIAPHWPTVIFAAALTITFPFCMALRWVSVLWACGYRVGYWQSVAITMAVWPLGTITPSKAGDVAKGFCVRETVPLAVGIGSVVTERALDVVILLLFSAIGGLILHETLIALLAGAGLCAAIAGWAVVALGYHLPVGPKLSQKLERFGETARVLLKSPKWLAVCAAASAANWFFSFWQTQLLYKAYGAEVSLLFVCAALPITIFVGLLPMTIAGMGTRDAAIIKMFAPFADKSISLSVGVLYTICGYWLPSIVGLPFMRRLLPAFFAQKKSENSNRQPE